jgi:hypothetical protein
MNEAQVWTIIGVFGATMIGLVTMVSTLFVRVLRTEIGRLDSKMDARFDTVGARFDGMDHRIDGLDRDVQALMRRTFGLDRGE